MKSSEEIITAAVDAIGSDLRKIEPFIKWQHLVILDDTQYLSARLP